MAGGRNHRHPDFLYHQQQQQQRPVSLQQSGPYMSSQQQQPLPQMHQLRGGAANFGAPNSARLPGGMGQTSPGIDFNENTRFGRKKNFSDNFFTYPEISEKCHLKTTYINSSDFYE
jgi:hypothetical protein